MSNLETTADARRDVPRLRGGDPIAGTAYHWSVACLSLLLIGGFVVDVWAHNHDKVDSTFFTPWHAILYSALLVLGVYFGVSMAAYHARGYPWRHSLPVSYRSSLAGMVLFSVGGVGDLVWHTLIGVEVDLDTLLSPTHLLLATAGILIITGPLRAAWRQVPRGGAPGWVTIGPALVAATLALAVLALFTQYAHPLVNTLAVNDTKTNAVLHDIYVMNADGTSQTRLASPPNRADWGPAWSPRGNKIVFTMGNPATSVGELSMANPDGSGITQLTRNGRNNYLPAWSPDGAKIAFVSQVGKDVNTAEIYSINVDGTSEHRLTSNDVWDYGTAWSPDSRRIAFGSKQGGTWNVYIMQADGSNMTLLPNTETGNAPAWSPDGTLIAFTANRTGHDNIYRVNADGSDLRRLTNNDGHNDNADWSPDGRSIAFSSNHEGNKEIYRMSADGTHPVNLTQNAALVHDIPVWSPDGSKISFTAVGHSPRPNPFFTQALGISSILVQSGLLMGMVLLLLSRWRLPFGAVTLVIAGSGAAVTVVHDHYSLLVTVVLTGVIADLVNMWWQPGATRPARFYGFAFGLPVVLYTLYLLQLRLVGSLDWSIHMAVGSVVFAGIVGLLLSFLLLPPFSLQAEQSSAGTS